MKYSKLFDRELATLLERRTDGIRRSIWPERGARKTLTKKQVAEAIGRLNEFAERQLMRSRPLMHLLRGPKPHSWRVKGRGRDHKVKLFKEWFHTLDAGRDFVYVIWSRTKCLYVGRTANGPSRTANHFKNAWFLKATRVEVHPFSGPRGVPRFECLMTHKLDPTEARRKPSAKRYHSYCPVCKVQKNIEGEVRSMFSSKRLRR